MKSIFGIVVALSVVGAAGCGSTGTDASGNPTPTPGSATFCGGFAVGPGLICDSSTTPHTLRIDFGSGATQVPAGNDSRFPSTTKGHLLGIFTPTETQANPPTLSAPGGLIPGQLNAVLYNAATQNGGIRAGNEICRSITNFPGRTEAVPSGHVCTIAELRANTEAGRIPTGASGRAYFDAAYSGYSTTADPTNNNFKASCGDGTYRTADLYSQSIWNVEELDPHNLFDAGKSIQLRVTTQTGGCGVVTPIACCE